jgi:hypothetical protein
MVKSCNPTSDTSQLVTALVSSHSVEEVVVGDEELRHRYEGD